MFGKTMDNIVYDPLFVFVAFDDFALLGTGTKLHFIGTLPSALATMSSFPGSHKFTIEVTLSLTWYLAFTSPNVLLIIAYCFMSGQQFCFLVASLAL